MPDPFRVATCNSCGGSGRTMLNTYHAATPKFLITFVQCRYCAGTEQTARKSIFQVKDKS
jgi:DnaJ-class molecular chaperone